MPEPFYKVEEDPEFEGTPSELQSTYGDIINATLDALQRAKGAFNPATAEQVFQDIFSNPIGRSPSGGIGGGGRMVFEGAKSAGRAFSEALYLLERGYDPSDPEVIRRATEVALNMLPGTIGPGAIRTAQRAFGRTKPTEVPGTVVDVGEDLSGAIVKPKPSRDELANIGDPDREFRVGSYSVKRYGDKTILYDEHGPHTMMEGPGSFDKLQQEAKQLASAPTAKPWGDTMADPYNQASPTAQHKTHTKKPAYTEQLSEITQLEQDGLITPQEAANKKKLATEDELAKFLSKDKKLQQEYMDQLPSGPVAHKNADGDWVVTGKYANGPGGGYGTMNFGKDKLSEAAAKQHADNMKVHFDQEFIIQQNELQAQLAAKAKPATVPGKTVGGQTILKKAELDKINDVPFNDMVNNQFNDKFHSQYVAEAKDNAPKLVKNQDGTYSVTGDSIKHTYPEGKVDFADFNDAILFHKLAIVNYQEQFKKKFISQNYVLDASDQLPKNDPNFNKKKKANYYFSASGEHTVEEGGKKLTFPTGDDAMEYLNPGWKAKKAANEAKKQQAQTDWQKMQKETAEAQDKAFGAGKGNEQVEWTSQGSNYGSPHISKTKIKELWTLWGGESSKAAAALKDAYHNGVGKVVINNGNDTYFINLKPKDMRKEPTSRLEAKYPDAVRTDTIGLNDPHPGPVIAYHGTGPRFQTTPGAKGEDFVFGDLPKSADIGWHFGTTEQATNMAMNKGAGEGKVIPAYLDIRKPYEMADHGSWPPAQMAKEIERKAQGTADQVDAQKLVVAVEQLRMDVMNKTLAPGERRQKMMDLIRNYLDDHGYDSIRYKNGAEGTGWSYIVWKRGKVKSATSPDHTLYVAPQWPVSTHREQQDGDSD